MKRTKALLVMLPAYNEAACIGALLDKLKAAGVPDMADLLVIDDGSADGTGRIARARGCAVVTHPRNMGYGRALLTGYKYAVRHGYAHVIQMDADGQHDPDNIRPIYERLLENAGDGPDIVLGSRFLEGGRSFPLCRRKRAAIGLFRRLVRLCTGYTITDPTSGLQGLSSRALRYYAASANFDDRYPDANMLIQMLLLGYQIQEVPAVMHPRRTGRGMYDGLAGQAAYMAHMTVSICAVLFRCLRLRTKRRDGRKEMRCKPAHSADRGGI